MATRRCSSSTKNKGGRRSSSDDDDGRSCGSSSGSSSDSDDSILQKAAFASRNEQQQRKNPRRGGTTSPTTPSEYLRQLVDGRRLHNEKAVTLIKMEWESKQRESEREERRKATETTTTTTATTTTNTMHQDSSSTDLPSTNNKIYDGRNEIDEKVHTHPINDNEEDSDDDNDNYINNYHCHNIDETGTTTPTTKIRKSLVGPMMKTLYQRPPQIPPTYAHAMDCLYRLLLLLTDNDDDDKVNKEDHENNNNNNTGSKNKDDVDNNNTHDWRQFVLDQLKNHQSLDLSSRSIRLRILPPSEDWKNNKTKMTAVEGSRNSNKKSRGRKSQKAIETPDDKDKPVGGIRCTSTSSSALRGFWHWLIMMACHHVHHHFSVATTSQGAYQLLMEWMDEPQSQRLFQISDMIHQWKAYFGINITIKNDSEDKTDTPTNPTTTTTTDSNTITNKDKEEQTKGWSSSTKIRSTSQGHEAVGRFLAIWDKLFTRGLVVVPRIDSDETVVGELVMILVMAGTDSLLQEHRIVLHRIMNHVLNFLQPPSHPVEYPSFFCRVPTVGDECEGTSEQGNARGKSNNRPELLLPYRPYAVGWVHLCEAAPWHWQSSICRLVLEQALLGIGNTVHLGMDEKDESNDDNEPSDQATVGRKRKYSWTFSSPSKELFQMAYMGLIQLKPIIQRGEHGRLCLNVLEIIILCLRHGLQMEDYDGHLDDRSSSSLHDYFDDILILANDLFSLSQPHVLSDVEFQHLNYYLLCLKQFLRLEKPTHGKRHHSLGGESGSGGIGGGNRLSLSPKQGTLDSFLVSKTPKASVK